MILSHIKTGYPKLYQQIIAFKGRYNELSDRFLHLYLEILDDLQKQVALSFNYSRIIYAISVAYWSSLDHKSPLGKAITENVEAKARVRLGSYVTDLTSNKTAQTICVSVNELLPKYFKIIRNVWQENEFLENDYSNIRKQFTRIQNNVRAGATLKGFCLAGREAKFE